MKRRSVLIGGLACLAGCGILPKLQEPTTLYTLTPKTRFPPDLPKVSWQLVVDLPTAAAGIDSSRIALTHDPFTLEYYAKAAWTDNAPGMVQTLLVESFERTGKIIAVGPEASGLRPDYLLQTDLREFQANYRDGDPAPTVAVRMNAKLVAMPERRIIAGLTARDAKKAASGKFEDVLIAFDDAVGHVLRQIVVFTLTTPPPAS